MKSGNETIEEAIYEELLDGAHLYDRFIAKCVITNAWWLDNSQEDEVIDILRGMIANGLVEVTNTINYSDGRTLCKYKAKYTL